MKKVKIRITETSKQLISLAEAPAVNRMIEQLQADETETIIPDFLGNVMCCIVPFGSKWEFFNVKAEICKNCRIYNYYTDDSADFDVWVKFYAYSPFDGFYVVGICLSDIYSIAEDNKEEIRRHMYVRTYKEIAKCRVIAP